MKQLRLLVFAMLALFAFGAVGAAVASAEVELEAKPPALLLLDKENVEELKYTGSEKSLSKIETVGGKTIECTLVEVKADGFKPLSAIRKADTNLGLADIDFTGCKKEKVSCRSETAKAEKDPVETILVKADIHIATEKSTAGVLEPLLIAKVTGTDAGVLFINCGGVKEEVKGKVPLLLEPGLQEVEAGGNFTIKSEQEKGKAKTGTCLEEKVDCEGLEKEPLEANLGSGKFEGAGEQFTVKGSFNKMVFIDD